jgi:hypothetical protein
MVSAVMEAVLLYDMAPARSKLGSRKTGAGRLRGCVAGAGGPWVKKKRSLGGGGGEWAVRRCHVPGGNKAPSLGLRVV